MLMVVYISRIVRFSHLLQNWPLVTPSIVKLSTAISVSVANTKTSLWKALEDGMLQDSLAQFVYKLPRNENNMIGRTTVSLPKIGKFH